MLTIPNASCIIDGETNVLTLRNKTLTDSTNNMMAKLLKKVEQQQLRSPVLLHQVQIKH